MGLRKKKKSEIRLIEIKKKKIEWMKISEKYSKNKNVWFKRNKRNVKSKGIFLKSLFTLNNLYIMNSSQSIT